MRFVLLFYVLLGLLAPVSSHAGDDSIEVQRAREARHFTVRVKAQISRTFSPDLGNGGHGTGFIVELDIKNNTGMVFTNRHVIESDAFDIRKVGLEISTHDGRTVSIPGTVVFVSDVYDFAIVKFEPSKLKPEILKTLTTAKLPTEDDFLSTLHQGRSVMTYGFPLDGSHVSNFGRISGLGAELDASESAIMTDAAINPGNSGGPLIDLKTGTVIGVNTAKRVGADLMGYAIPILPLIEDYRLFREDPLSVARKVPNFLYEKVETPILEKLGVVPLIKGLAPDYFERHSGVIMVTTSPVGCPFKSGDLLVAVEGEVLGTEMERLQWHARLKKRGHLEVIIVRGLSLQTVKLPILNLTSERENAKFDFVMFSGLLLQDLTRAERMYMTQGGPGVKIADLVEGTFASENSGLIPGSLIQEIQAGDRSLKVKTLAEVKDFLAHVQPGELLKVFFRPAMPNPSGPGVLALSILDGQPVLLPIIANQFVPFDGIVTPENFPIKEFKAGFDFSGMNPKSIDWRLHVNCPKTVSQAAKGAGRLSRKA